MLRTWQDQYGHWGPNCKPLGHICTMRRWLQQGIYHAGGVGVGGSNPLCPTKLSYLERPVLTWVLEVVIELPEDRVLHYDNIIEARAVA